MKEKIEEQVAQYRAWGLREVEAEAAMGALLAQSILVARLGKLEAVANAARAVCADAVTVGRDGAGVAVVIDPDVAERLADALLALDALDKT